MLIKFVESYSVLHVWDVHCIPKKYVTTFLNFDDKLLLRL